MSGSPSKRRDGSGDTPVADPRPVVRGRRVVGVRCAACGYPSAPAAPWCPVCHQREQRAAEFGPGGTVWSSTLVHIPVGRWKPPYALAYVDLDDGPRVLAHLRRAESLPSGTRVRIVGAEEGDLIVAAENEA